MSDVLSDAAEKFCLMLLLAGAIGKQGAAPSSPPTIHGFESLQIKDTPAAPESYSLAGQTWSVGDYLLALFGLDAAALVNSVVGVTNDTYAEVAEVTDGVGSTITTYEGTVVGGALDASITVAKSANRDNVGGLITISGAAANANQPNVAPSSNTGSGNRTPVCSSITTDVDNCLIFAMFHARGGHFELGAPAAPTGTGTWTFLFAGATGTSGVSTAQSSVAVAYKVQAVKGATGDASWTNAMDDNNTWAAQQYAVEPA